MAVFAPLRLGHGDEQAGQADKDAQGMFFAPLWLSVAAVTGLLVADRGGYRAWEWVAKPLAASAFLWAALSWGALESAYGRSILLGLTLCAAGDVLLLPKGRNRWFLAGMGAFLLGHLAYAAAFAILPLNRLGGLLALGAMGATAAVVMRWLLPSVPKAFRVPIIAYIAAISLMVAMATAAVTAGASWWLLGGAVGFAASDLAVARNRFIAPGFVNRLWGLPLYFGSQLLIASTVATPA